MVISLNGQDSTLTTCEISIRRGIFQGDTLFPILFCLFYPSSSSLSIELSRTEGHVQSYYVGKGKNADHCMNHLPANKDQVSAKVKKLEKSSDRSHKSPSIPYPPSSEAEDEDDGDSLSSSFVFEPSDDEEEVTKLKAGTSTFQSLLCKFLEHS
ncbi:unnamed protein product [Darwinula stevensoni]|uniref:Uncharacterized protein n=1 Tax=Darwinula stevensoni TaxID=69355 RepID=A0A7R8XEA9_9CRUS|nr:unnamed protein product [Darwinula stevensoni]CAG0895616.1 unnamed protein product [Darwinula stevensoni]